MSGNFFAVGRGQIKKAFTLGLNPGVAFLVMARGTGKDNSTTAWSAEAISKCTGMSWRRAKEAIGTLKDNCLTTVTGSQKSPRYKLTKPADDADLIWLPNELVTGAGNEVPPVQRLRERQDAMLLHKFIQLYHLHDLTGDGGLPRKYARQNFKRDTITSTGKFILYRFTPLDETANSQDIFEELNGKTDDEGNKGAWIVIAPLVRMGLIEKALYMVESDNYESELLYPVNDETGDALYGLSGHFEASGATGFSLSIINNLPYVGLALREQKSATMVGVYRLKYRPKTSRTAAWWGGEQEQVKHFVEGIDKMCGVPVQVSTANTFKIS